MEWLGYIADVIGIIGAVFAVRTWLLLDRDRKRKEKTVTVAIQHGAEKIELPVELRRGELTRAELLGRIGMIPTKNKARFSLTYLNTTEFFRQLNTTLDGDYDALLTIPCSAEEFVQFDLR